MASRFAIPRCMPCRLCLCLLACLLACFAAIADDDSLALRRYELPCGSSTLRTTVHGMRHRIGLDCSSLCSVAKPRGSWDWNSIHCEIPHNISSSSSSSSTAQSTVRMNDLYSNWNRAASSTLQCYTYTLRCLALAPRAKNQAGDSSGCYPSCRHGGVSIKALTPLSKLQTRPRPPTHAPGAPSTCRE